MSTDDDFAAYVSHDDFRAGLPQGRFRVIVDPRLARGWVRQRLWLLPVVMAMVGAGLALALGGATWPGVGLVVAGVALNRLVAWNAGKILLHLALSDPAVYDAATGGGILEVRRV